MNDQQNHRKISLHNMIAILTVTMLLGVDDDRRGSNVELTLSVNSRDILQHDLLVVKSVLANRGEVWIEMTGKSFDGRRMRYQQKVGGKWVPLPAMSGYRRREDGGIPALNFGRAGQIIAQRASCAEYDMILFDSQDNFVVDDVGKYEIRSIAETSAGELVSPPVIVEVKPRSAHDLARIESAKEHLFRLGLQSNASFPQVLVDLGNIGGNMGTRVNGLLFLERIRSGEEKVGEEHIAKFLGRHMKGVDREVALIWLGGHFYDPRMDYDRLAEVVDSIPDMTRVTKEWSDIVDSRKRKQVAPVAGADK